ncbi:MAG: DUF3298 domain-containing protein [Oscillospiraceae bacterium]|jgi:hypothetical protein|nr:DUF3298 domain-containing protein [Oscillospiraceae bacterium]
MKHLSVCAAFLAVCLLFQSCGGASDPAAESDTPPATESAYVTKDDDSEVAVDRNLIVTKDTVTEAEALEQIRGLGQGSMDAYVVQQEKSYLGTWYRRYYIAQPKLTAEEVADDAVREKLNAHFASLAVPPTQTGDFDESAFDFEETVYDNYSSYENYYYLNYGLGYVGAYLNVFYSDLAYLGGAHGDAMDLPEVYSLTTGEQVYIWDVVNLDIGAYFINDIVNAYCTANAIDIFNVYDLANEIAEYGPESVYFYLKDGALVMSFAPYAIAPYAAGQFEVEIPVSDFPPGALQITW